MSDWIQDRADGALLTLHIQPGAKTSAVAGLHGDALKIRLAAPPVDGKANAALLAFIATQLKLSKQQVSLVSGQASRAKRVLVTGIQGEEIRRILLTAAA
ncbi:DUF167 family protein YggU [Denitratisoma sp. agr-D3]